MTKEFFPDKEADQSSWAINLKSKLPLYASNLEISPSSQANMIASCKEITDEINAVQLAKATLKKAISRKNAAKAKALLILRKEIARAKTAPNYTIAIGKDLGIVSINSSKDNDNFKPSLKGESFPGYVRLSFIKKDTDGVNIYTRLKGSATFQFLARDSFSPFDDKRPLNTPTQAEIREYMAIAVIGDEQVGQQSNIISVVFSG